MATRLCWNQFVGEAVRLSLRPALPEHLTPLLNSAACRTGEASGVARSIAVGPDSCQEFYDTFLPFHNLTLSHIPEANGARGAELLRKRLCNSVGHSQS